MFQQMNPCEYGGPWQNETFGSNNYTLWGFPCFAALYFSTLHHVQTMGGRGIPANNAVLMAANWLYGSSLDKQTIAVQSQHSGGAAVSRWLDQPRVRGTTTGVNSLLL